MAYHKQLTVHLSHYRERVLGVHECGEFVYRGKALPKGHILPVELKWFNILPGVRGQIQGYLAKHPRIRLHRYFHHLNSSQAFALNLFVPYFEGGTAAQEALLRALKLHGELGTWRPEDIPVEEEETNIDVSWILGSGQRTLCEVKLSESEFGTAEPDAEHLAKIAAMYVPALKGQVDEELLEHEAFCRHYQLLRMAWHAVREPSATLMFLLPRANRHLWRALPEVTRRFSVSLRRRVRRVAVETVLGRLCGDPQVPLDLRSHAEALCAKYIPNDQLHAGMLPSRQ